MTTSSGTSLRKTVTAWTPPAARTLTQLTRVSVQSRAAAVSAPSPGTSASAGIDSER